MVLTGLTLGLLRRVPAVQNERGVNRAPSQRLDCLGLVLHRYWRYIWCMDRLGVFWLWGYLEALDGFRRVCAPMTLAQRAAYDAGRFAASNERMAA